MVTEVGIVVVEVAADIEDIVQKDKKELTLSGETSQLKVAFLMLKALHRKIDLQESIIRQKKVKKVEKDLLTDQESISNMILERIQ